MRSFSLNLLIAMIWLFLSKEPSLVAFVLGGAIGFAVLAAFRAVLGSGDYVRRVFALGRFALAFVWEFLTANAEVVWIVLRRSREDLQPNFITYDTTGLKPFEVMLVFYCISLTPGSTAVKVTDDFNTLVLHVLEAGDAAAIRRRIDHKIRRGILSFTR